MEHLHAADKELRLAMRIAGDAKMVLVTNDIRESEWYLDEALAHASTTTVKNNSRKLLTADRACAKVCV